MYSTDTNRASLFSILNAIKTFCIGAPMIVGIPMAVYSLFYHKTIQDYLCFICFPVSLLFMCVSGQSYPHYGMILCPLITWAASRVVPEINLQQLGKRQKRALFLSIPVGLFLLFYPAVIMNAKQFAGSFKHSEDQIHAEQIARIVKENTDDDDLITVCGNWNTIYLLSDRDSASMYSYQLPPAEVSTKIKEEYLRDVRNLSAKAIVINDDCSLYEDVMLTAKEYYRLLAKEGNTEVYIRK
jgi:hypothetical protein